ncbi:MAG: hypothetical protein QM817_20765 [Archangium sp.]
MSIRDRTCPHCRSPTGAPFHAAYASIDRSLNTYRLLAFGALTWLPFVALLVHELHPAMGIALGCFSVAAFVVQGFGPTSWRTWLGAAAVWAVLSLCAAAFGLSSGAAWRSLVALALLLPIGWMMRPDFRARLRGEAPRSAAPASEVPRPGPCATCGDRDSEVIAPLFVISMLSFTTRFPGRFVNACPQHARMNAVFAVACCVFLGWWGFPWGLIWTADALAKNVLDGGVTLDSEALREWRAQEREDGGERPMPIADYTFGLILGGVALFAGWYFLKPARA